MDCLSTHIDPPRLSHLIGLVYDAAIDAPLWPIAMEAIRIEMSCANAALALHSLPDGAVLINRTTNIPQPYHDRIADYGAEVIELWGGAAKVAAVPLDEPLVLSRLNPAAIDGEQPANRYVREWARPQGLLDVVTVGLARDSRAVGSLAFGRHESAGAFGARDVEVIRLLVPHLQRAATINRMLDAAAIERETFEAAIDALAIPVLLTDSAMSVLHANPAARRMLAAGDLIHERPGTLATISAPATRALAIAVERAAEDITTLDRRGLSVPVHQPGGAYGALHILPLRPKVARPAAPAVVAVFVAQVATPFVAPTEIVAALFGLTPAESRIFHRAVAGETVAEAARTLGIEPSTVKTHLLRIYDKTGVRRRAELQQIAAALILPVEG